MKYECPKCKRPLASRRHKHCQYCGAELPERMLAPQGEIKAEYREWKQTEKVKQARQKETDAEEAARHASIG